MNLKEFLDYTSHFSSFDPDCPEHEEILELMLKRFNQLNNSDKLAVLLNANKLDQPICAINESINAEVEEIDKANSLEILHLRMWLIKTTILMFMFIFVMYIGIVSFSDRTGDKNAIIDSFLYLTKMFNLLFK